jgi:uncharacterized protein DUF1844
MTDDSAKQINMYFFQLVASLQAAAWQQMGKIASPITGEIERNLEQAKVSIDMLDMLSEKTKGNLSDEENQLITRALYDLKMNYVDETSKPDDKKADDSPGQENQSPSGDPADKASDNTDDQQSEDDKKEDS